MKSTLNKKERMHINWNMDFSNIDWSDVILYWFLGVLCLGLTGLVVMGLIKLAMIWF